MNKGRTIAVVILLILSCFAFSAKALKLPSLPSEWTISSLKTPEAISNALSRLSATFRRFLSPQTLTSVVKNQSEKLEENMDAFIENDSPIQAGKIVANALASAAAALALSGQEPQQAELPSPVEETMIVEEMNYQ